MKIGINGSSLLARPDLATVVGDIERAEAAGVHSYWLAQTADLRARLHEAFSRQISRHLDRQVHEIYGVDLVPVKTESDGGEALARYLGKIQLEMTRQDLKTGRTSTSRSPWEIGLDAAESGDARDAARWCEYLRATKGRNVVTRSPSLAALYGEPTEQELNDMLKDESIDDDQDDETDEATDVASADSALWMAASKLTRTGGSVADEPLTALEDHGPQGMADYLAEALGVPVEVTTHRESGLPHLRFSDLADHDRWASPQPATGRHVQRRSRCTRARGTGLVWHGS